jgi:hypothetical protein
MPRIATLFWCDDGEIARPGYFRTWATHKFGAATGTTSAAM